VAQSKWMNSETVLIESRSRMVMLMVKTWHQVL